MPTPTKGPRLGGSPSHERMIIANLARSLFAEGRIRTTEAKAKRLRPQAERLITFAKRGDLAPMVLIELVEQGEVVQRGDGDEGDGGTRRRRFGRGRSAADGEEAAPEGSNRAARRAAARRRGGAAAAAP